MSNEPQIDESGEVARYVAHLMAKLQRGVAQHEIEFVFMKESETLSLPLRDAVLHSFREHCATDLGLKHSELPVPPYEQMELRAEKLADVAFGVKLLKRLGDPGGEGEVWLGEGTRAWDFQGHLAVKLYHRRDRPSYGLKSPAYNLPTRMEGQNLFHELQSLRGIRHDNVVSVLDGFETADNRLCLILEYVPEINLGSWKAHLRKHGLLVREAVSLIAFLADVLEDINLQAADCRREGQASEDVTLIHGDVKPSNILGFGKLQENIDLRLCKWSDFGAALVEKLANDPHNMANRQYGSLGFMAPEQFTAAFSHFELDASGNPSIPNGLKRSVTIDVFGLVLTLISLISPTDQTEFVGKVGDYEGWVALHQCWHNSEAGSTSRLNVFQPICRGKDERIPSVAEVRQVFENLDLPGLVDKVIPGEDEDTRVLRSICKACLTFDPSQRIQTPGAMAQLLARWLRDEETGFNCNRDNLTRNSSLEHFQLFCQSAMFRQRLLVRRYIVWNRTDDAVALGAFWWWPAAVICTGTAVALSAFNLSGSVQLVISISALTLILLPIVYRLIVLEIAVYYARKLRAKTEGKYIECQSTKSGLRSPRLRSRLFAIVYQAIKGCVNQFPMWGLVASYCVMWSLIWGFVGGVDTNEEMRKGDIAHMTATFCLFAGAACATGRDNQQRGLRRMFSTVAALSLFIAVWSAVTTPTASYNQVSGVLNYGLHVVMLFGYFWKAYVSPIVLGRREQGVSADFGSPSLRRMIFLMSSDAHGLLERDVCVKPISK